MEGGPTLAAPRRTSFRWAVPAPVRRLLPPARLVWLALTALAVYGSLYLAWVDLPLLIALPIVAVVADLALQRARFPRVRFPDAALATGLFVALLLPPTAPIAAIAAVTIAGVAGRHLLRWQGRPILNPAVSSVLLAVAIFGLAPAWWVGIGVNGLWLLLGLGAAVLAWVPSGRRLTLPFLAAFVPLTVVLHSLTGAAVSTQVVLLEILDPVTLFFAFFLVAEPRSAPAEPRAQVVYAVAAGVLGAVLPQFLPTVGILVALIVANGLSLVLRRADTAARPVGRTDAGPLTRGRARRAAARGERPAVWSIGTRVGVGVMVLAVLAASGALLPSAVPALPPGSSGGSGGGGGNVTLLNCNHDNPTIPASTLQTLHHLLGPSVILSYDSGTGLVRFYDPVNHVTVTETDLYEDYGFAEFNGDDGAVAGCSP